jgi:virginiamycin A acetyltransferase
LPGVKIGDGAIIGMGSVVGSDVEPYTIVAGNPSKMIRKRFDEELTGLMLKLKWWDLPVEEIMKLIPLLHDNDTEKVRKKLKAIVK